MSRRTIAPPDFGWIALAKAFWYLLGNYRKQYLLWTGFICLIYFYTLVPAILIAMIINFFTQYQAGDSLQYFYAVVVFWGLSYSLVSVLRLTAKNHLGALQSHVEYEARVQGFDKLTDLSIEWNDTESSGNKVQRIVTGLALFTQLQRMMHQSGFQTIVTLVGLLAFYAFTSVYFVLFFIAYCLLFVSINAVFAKKKDILINELNQSREDSSGKYFEGLSNITTIKTLGAQDSFNKSIISSEEATKNYRIKFIALGTNKWKIFQFFNGLMIIVYMLLVGQSFLIGSITLGSLAIFFTYMSKLIDAGGTVGDMYDDLIEARSAFARMMPIYYATDSHIKGTQSFPRDWSSITFDNVHFQYKKADRDATRGGLDGLTMQILKGQKIGIAGASGSGKSTLAKILIGLHQIESGSFTVDTHNYYDIRHQAITDHISLVLQETEIFNMSFLDNITLMRATDLRRVKQVIELAQLDDLVAKLSDGVNTMLGEKGYRLSGGERQRIGIARALYKDSDLLILDESTSALDGKTEQKIHLALEAHARDKTLIIIAHRTTTLAKCDIVYVMEHGKIVESGSYRELKDNEKSKFNHVAHLSANHQNHDLQ